MPKDDFLYTPDMEADVMQAKQRFSIVGNSPALLMAIARAIRVAPIDLSVLVTGESGSGKEFFPKIIHQFGARKHKKYIAVNCGAIPEGTIDSELFGHEKGSFTGAISSRKGYFEEADGGTIFLDEVAELPLTTQARLLRVLETGEYLRVGSSEVLRTNIRIVAATNVDLLRAVRDGKFREDLYYRLSTVTIQVPSLHDRGDDIHLLARKFASDFSRKYMTEPITFTPDAVKTMMLYRWPGNVRQLKNIVDQLALFHSGDEISRDTLLEALPLDHSGNSIPAPISHPDSDVERKMLWNLVLSLKADLDLLRSQISSEFPHMAHPEGNDTPSVTTLVKYPETDLIGCNLGNDTTSPLDRAERQAIIEALEKNGGDKARTAAQLGVSLRTLYRKIREFKIGN